MTSDDELEALRAEVERLRRGREPLPPRRSSETYELCLRRTDGERLTVFVGVGRYPDGRLGEVFIDSRQKGERRTAYEVWARLASHHLQRGGPVEELATNEAGIPGESARVECPEVPGVDGVVVGSVFGAARLLLVVLERERAQGVSGGEAEGKRVGGGPRRAS